MSNPQIESLFVPELELKEKVLWTGQPDPSHSFMKADYMVVPISMLLVFMAVALIFLTAHGGNKSEPDLSFYLFMYPVTAVFIAAAAYFSIGRFWLKRWFKKETYFAITNRRVIFMRKRPMKYIVGVILEQIQTTREDIRSDGSGHLILGNLLPQFGFFGNTGLDFGGAFSSFGLAFYDLYDVVEAKQIVEGARQKRLLALAALE